MGTEHHVCTNCGGGFYCTSLRCGEHPSVCGAEDCDPGRKLWGRWRQRSKRLKLYVLPAAGPLEPPEEEA